MVREIIYLIFISIFFFTGCRTETSIITDRNLAYLYNPSLTSLHPRYKVFHNNDEASTLYVKVYPVELLFNQANEEGVYRAELKVFYRLYELDDFRMMVDSGYNHYYINMQNVRKDFIAQIPIQAKRSRKYNLEVITHDVLRKKAVQAYIPVDKTSGFNAQNFKIFRYSTGSSVFNPILDSNLVVRLQFPNETADSLYVHFYKNFPPLPLPPSYGIPTRSLGNNPDSIWHLRYSDTLPIRLTTKGVYHFKVNPDVREGYTLFYFGEFFPSIKTPEQMIEPLEYILSANEMRGIRNRSNPKLVVDNFWINVAGNIDKARELIRIYYNRVLYANYFFVSDREGWKTDRGMIYIVYGPPDILFKNDKEEVWFYGKKKKSDKISFTFRKVNSSFTENEYRLVRGEEVYTRWADAVSSWKSGKVFDMDEQETR
ncbi:MAG: GWxTD domain-containing protein [Bacteroidales bacterium]|nr:GWxTD domain-containing protein [Bacteroidales bacterium]